MNPNFIYWCFAYAWMSLVVVIGVLAVRQVRAGDLAGHMRKMILVCNMLLFFVVTYVVKVLVLGRELKEGWEMIDFIILYTHEAFIAIMLVTGTWARLLGNKVRARLDNPTDADMAMRRRHKKLGQMAFLSAFAALVTATGVMWTLYRHLN